MWGKMNPADADAITDLVHSLSGPQSFHTHLLVELITGKGDWGLEGSGFRTRSR